jgi:DNA-binding PadR family transcriptional regulator
MIHLPATGPPRTAPAHHDPRGTPHPMIELAILGLLDDDDLHGYELRKRLTDLLGMHLAISFGSLYPALSRLERAGYVKAVTTRTAGAGVLLPAAPMSGSLTGELAAFRRQRRSEAGAGATTAGTTAGSTAGTTGGAKAGRSTGGRARKVYGLTDTGRERLHALLVDPDVSDDRTFAVRVAFCHHLSPAERLDLFGGRVSTVNTYLRSLLERDIESITADIAWLDRVIEAERSGGPIDPPTADRRATPTSTDTGGSR